METSPLSEIVKSFGTLRQMTQQALLNLHHDHQQRFEAITQEQAEKGHVLQMLQQTAPMAVAPPSTAAPVNLAMTLMKASCV
ncbi:uncharacterized [Tachysurus ichikawai]